MTSSGRLGQPLDQRDAVHALRQSLHGGYGDRGQSFFAFVSVLASRALEGVLIMQRETNDVVSIDLSTIDVHRPSGSQDAPKRQRVKD